jgi:hypothetical protein
VKRDRERLAKDQSPRTTIPFGILLNLYMGTVLKVEGERQNVKENGKVVRVSRYGSEQQLT